MHKITLKFPLDGSVEPLEISNALMTYTNGVLIIRAPQLDTPIEIFDATVIEEIFVGFISGKNSRKRSKANYVEVISEIIPG